MGKTAVIALLVLCAAANAFTLGGKDKKGGPDSGGGIEAREVEVSGTVRLVGNSPMTSLVLSGTSPDSGGSRDWYIAPEEEQKLMAFQQQAITVRAWEYYYDRTFANGAPAPRQYYLKNIVIVSAVREAW